MKTIIDPYHSPHGDARSQPPTSISQFQTPAPPDGYTARVRGVTRVWLLTLLLATVSLALFAHSHTAQAAEARPVEPPATDAPTESPTEVEAYDYTSFLLVVQPHTDVHGIETRLAAQDLRLVRYWPEMGVVHAQIRDEVDDEVMAAATVAQQRAAADNRRAALAADPAFQYVEFDGIVTIAQTGTTQAGITQTGDLPDLEPEPNDARLADQYALTNINARQAWNITHGDPAVTVAVIDTGYASQHEDFLQENVWRNQAEFSGLPNIDDDANGFIDDIVGWDWYANGNSPEDGNGHGTHIMGTIVAATDNGTGIAGLGRAVRVAPLRIFGPSGSGRISDLVAAIDYAVDQNIPIINLSLTTSTDSPSLRTAVENASGQGILVVAATGNMSVGSSFTSVQYPAVYPTTLAVAATNANDNWAPFSRYGPTVDIAAPGDRILSTYLNSEYRNISGTSMATAHVSALAALLRSLRPDLTAAEIVEIILATAEDVNADSEPGNDIYLGAGRIDMVGALLSASTALTLTTDGFGIVPSQTGVVSELRVAVTAPPAAEAGPRLPVHNAVVHFRQQTDGDAPAADWQRAFTNGSGEALVTVEMNNAVEIVELQVGAVTRTVEVTMLPADARLVLTPTEISTVAGSQPISFSVQLQNEAGDVITASLPVDLQTDLGQFVSAGARQARIDLVDGVYNGLLDAGTVSGTGHFTAAIGPYHAASQLTVAPAKPYTITRPTTQFPEVSISANSVLLEFQVFDRYGNPAADGTVVTLYATEGILEEATLYTENGRAAVSMRLPTPQTTTIAVWVVVHAGPVEIRVDIPPVRVRTWLPALPRGTSEWRD